MSEMSEKLRAITINAFLDCNSMTDSDKLIKFTNDFLELIKPLAGNTSPEIDIVQIDPSFRGHRGVTSTFDVVNLQDVYPDVKRISIQISIGDE